MIITPVNTATIAKAIQTMLKNWQPLVDMQARVDRAEYVNRDPGACPWLGVYVVGEDYVSRTLGLGPGYRMQKVGCVVVAQQASTISGELCQDELEALKQAAISCLLSDPSLGNTVAAIDQFSVRYAQYEKQAGQPAFQSAVINFTGLVPVNAS